MGGRKSARGIVSVENMLGSGPRCARSRNPLHDEGGTDNRTLKTGVRKPLCRIPSTPCCYGLVAFRIYLTAGIRRSFYSLILCVCYGPRLGGFFPMSISRIKDPIRGRTFRCRWANGPTANMAQEHVFHLNGSLEWRLLDGPDEGRSAKELTYAVLPVADDVYLVSYRTRAGQTLTAALNFRTRELAAVTASQDDWY